MDGIDTTGGASSVSQLRASPATTTTAPVAGVPGTAPAATPAADSAANLISLLADAAPPIDTKKVQAIQSLIASGAYPIDPHQIAQKMLALDFPQRG